MAKEKGAGKRSLSKPSTRKTPKSRTGPQPKPAPAGKPSSLLDTRVIYCGDCLEKLADLPDNCVDLIYISQIRRGGDPPFNSNRNYDPRLFWGETKEKRAHSGGEDRHASIFRGQAYIDSMRPRCVQLARVLKKTGSFYSDSSGSRCQDPRPIIVRPN